MQTEATRTRLTTNTVVDGQPAYSPDGTKILFASGDAMNPNGIEIYRDELKRYQPHPTYQQLSN